MMSNAPNKLTQGAIIMEGGAALVVSFLFGIALFVSTYPTFSLGLWGLVAAALTAWVFLIANYALGHFVKLTSFGGTNKMARFIILATVYIFEGLILGAIVASFFGLPPATIVLALLEFFFGAVGAQLSPHMFSV